MKKTNLLKTGLIALSLGLSAISCGSDGNTDIFETPQGPVQDPMVDPTGVTQSAEINIAFDSSLPEGEQRTGTFFALATGEAGGKVNGRVQFTSDRDMRRLYITRTLPGGEPEPFADFDELDSKQIRQATKPDGSIDLDGDRKNAFDFTFELDVPTNATDGETIYNFWATSGRGDFTDPSKRLLVGVGTIEVKIGTANVTKELIKFNGLELKAALADGSSSTFASFFDLTRTYKINEGADFSAFWDFGYFFDGSTSEASIYSTNSYPSLVDIVSISNAEKTEGEEDITRDDLKKTYFKINSEINFSEVTVTQIEALTVSSSNSQNIVDLSDGDVLEFLSDSGRKGLIEVVRIEGGAGSNGRITLNVIQLPANPIMNGSNM